MQNVVKIALIALVAVMCVDALAATGASAEEPLQPLALSPVFLTAGPEELLFTGSGGAVTLRSKQAGVEGTISCERTLSFTGLAVTESALVNALRIELNGRCEQTVGSSKDTCSEPIKLELSYGQLGLLHNHVFLLVAPENGTLFATVKCTNGNTQVRGAVIGEFPLNGRGGSLQYGVSLEDFLLLYKAKGITQEPEEIELAGGLMKGVGLTTEGLFSGKASAEATELLKFDGLTEIQLPQPTPPIGIRPIGAQGGGRCTIVNRIEVEFRAVNEWCEYEIRNELAGVVDIVAVRLNRPTRGECTRIGELCTINEAPEMRRRECRSGEELAARGGADSECYIKLKYNFKPRRAQTISFDIAAATQTDPVALTGGAARQSLR
jgi:hypothetical protein